MKVNINMGEHSDSLLIIFLIFKIPWIKLFHVSLNLIYSIIKFYK